MKSGGTPRMTWPAWAKSLGLDRGRLILRAGLVGWILFEGVCPVLGEGMGETFSLGGINCPASDVDLDEKPTPSGPDPLDVVPIDPLYVGWAEGSEPVLLTPVGVDPSLRYFNFNNQLVTMVGVSADIGCNLHMGTHTETSSDICTFDTGKLGSYLSVLTDAKAKGLNKIRVLVGYNGLEPDPAPGVCYKPPNPEDYPFEYVAGEQGSLGYWRLDRKNTRFFGNLRTVVQEARKRGIFVEVTFFAPWFGVWEYGPWNASYGKVETAPGQLESVGFTSRSDFVKIAPSGDSPALAKVRQVQRNVIRWTIDTLWDQSRVYWEIANEPENPDPTPTADCSPVDPPAVDAVAVKAWQEMMINEAESYERTTYMNSRRRRRLTRPHLIAVQPFSVTGLGHYVNNPKVAIINGHYTRVAATPMDLGAIELVRRAAASGRVIGFNEGKISGVSGNQGTADNGKADSARSEAYEFALNLGGAYDHFGYHYSSSGGVDVRRQLGLLKGFLATLPLDQLKVVPDAVNQPSWIDLDRYDISRAGPSFKYWAALEPKPGATGVLTYVAYMHHSRSRQLAFDGYRPLTLTAPPYYSSSETYKLCFGAAGGRYEVDWICPKNGQRTGGQTIQWIGSSTCSHGGPGSVSIQPPAWPGGSAPGCDYTYDILLRVRKTG